MRPRAATSSCTARSVSLALLLAALAMAVSGAVSGAAAEESSTWAWAVWAADEADAQRGGLPKAVHAPDTAFTVNDAGRDAYDHLLPLLQGDALEQARDGRALVRQTWVISPSVDPHIAGLGPTYNQPACTSCHARMGAGGAPDRPEAPFRSLLVRLSVPGRDAHGGPVPEPRYGDQLNELGVPGVPGEGEAFLQWQAHSVILGDGTTIELRAPVLAFRGLTQGPMAAGVMTSVRVAPALLGMGWLDAVPDAALRALASAQAQAAQRGARGEAGEAGAAVLLPHGRVNEVWNVAAGAVTVGHFGWKANQPDLQQQIAGALAGDMGLTNALFPQPNCPPVQQACARWSADRHPEVSGPDLAAMTFYTAMLALPARRGATSPQVLAGERLFAQAGCAVCHAPRLPVAVKPPFDTVLKGSEIHPYTDLLLHDMGEALADGRPDYQAGPQDWRTPPLWGMGLRQVVNPQAGWLHDGRARSPLEAILWHGGEATTTRETVRRWSASDRDALLAFLASL
jgi:CxxC motif-containing protein (DUF1111 family)